MSLVGTPIPVHDLPGCPRDSDGDGHCGNRHCHLCGGPGRFVSIPQGIDPFEGWLKDWLDIIEGIPLMTNLRKNLEKQAHAERQAERLTELFL